VYTLHTTEGCSTNYSDVEEDKQEAGEKDVKHKTGTHAGENSTWDFHKEGAQLPNHLLWLSRASTKMRPPSISKYSTLLSVLMLYYIGVINCWLNKPVSTVFGLEG
jgi:hypothetical protein